jgi:hypothetical protein
MKFRRKAGPDGRLEALARKIEAVVEKDRALIRQARECAALRRRAAVELYAMCRAPVEALNRLLPSPLVELSPPEFSEDAYRDDSSNIFQINVSGRIVQLEFHAAPTPLSTERFHTPYILEGSLRAFNQEYLEMSQVPEHPVFCCPKGERLEWIWFDARLQRAAVLDQQHLISLLERVI